MSFFENNLPVKAPWIDPRTRGEFEYVSAKVRRRMSKLDKALSLSGMRGETFSAALSPLFQADSSTDGADFDSMTAKQIADAAILLARSLDESKIPDRIEWPNCLTMVDTAFVSNKEWEKLRMVGIGGSDSACIINEGYRSALEIYHDKRGTPVQVDTESGDTGKAFIFEYGHKVEPLVIDHFCRISGAHRVPETRMFCHKDYPFLTANIDQIIQFDDGRMFVYEAKTTTLWNRDAWKNGAIPRQYVPQCHKYPIVLNDPRILGTYIGCIYGNTPGDYYCSFVERDTVEEQAQIEREVEFWEKNVCAGVPPKGGDPEKNLRALYAANGYGDKSLPAMELPEEHLPALLRIYQNTQKIKTLQDEIEETKKFNLNLAAKVMETMDQTCKATLDCPGEFAPSDGEYEFCVNWSPRSRASVDLERLRLAYPDVYQDVVDEQGTTFKPFTVSLKRKKKKK